MQEFQEDGIWSLRLNDSRDLLTAYVQVAQRFNNSEVWWRGQPKRTHDLYPGIFRMTTDHGNETSLLTRFKTMSPARVNNCPEQDDRAGWLFLAQHHRLWTRLLDWSTSILIGAIFACNKDPNDDGVLWALDPFKLNEKYWGRDEVFSHPYGPPQMQALIDDAFETNMRQWCHLTAAVYPVQTHPRIMQQQSAFTIHGTPVPINHNEYLKNTLYRIIVPANLKNMVLLMLDNIGIRNEYVFPDLDHLARSINVRQFYRNPVFDT